MKNLKFWPFLMALVMGMSFAFVSCDDDDDSKKDEAKTTVSKGQSFYSDCQVLTDGESTTEDLTATADMIAMAAEYTENKSDKAWVTEFLAGIAIEKFGVSEEVAKSEEYLDKVSSVKSLLDDGITLENSASALSLISEFINGNSAE